VRCTAAVPSVDDRPGRDHDRCSRPKPGYFVMYDAKTNVRRDYLGGVCQSRRRPSWSSTRHPVLLRHSWRQASDGLGPHATRTACMSACMDRRSTNRAGWRRYVGRGNRKMGRSRATGQLERAQLRFLGTRVVGHANAFAPMVIRTTRRSFDGADLSYPLSDTNGAPGFWLSAPEADDMAHDLVFIITATRGCPRSRTMPYRRSSS